MKTIDIFSKLVPLEMDGELRGEDMLVGPGVLKC